MKKVIFERLIFVNSYGIMKNKPRIARMCTDREKSDELIFIRVDPRDP